MIVGIGWFLKRPAWSSIAVPPAAVPATLNKMLLMTTIGAKVIMISDNNKCSTHDITYDNIAL